MRWKQFALWILAVAFATGEIVAAEEPTSSPMFQQWIVNRTRFSLVGGRVVAIVTMAPGCSACRSRSRRTARFANRSLLTAMESTGSLAYTYQRSGDQADQQNDPRVEFALDISSEGRFALRYSDKDHPDEMLRA